MENIETVDPVVAESVVPSLVENSSEMQDMDKTFNFSQDDIVRAREQEKAKLYPQLEKLKDELNTLKKERDERAAEEERSRQATATEAQKKLEEDMDIRALLTKKEQEFQSQLEAERLERERAFALLDQERQFQELMQFRQQRLEAERENIIPELIDLIEGETRDEVCGATLTRYLSRRVKRNVHSTTPSCLVATGTQQPVLQRSVGRL